MYEEAKEKTFILNNKISIILLFISIISISGSVAYTFFNKCECTCPKCICKKEKIKEAKKVRVDVKGEVVNPGVQELSSNLVVMDAINAAGGIKEDATLENINLSKKVTDEMVIYVFNKELLEKESINNEVVCEIPKCNCETININNDNQTTTNDKISINTAGIDELTSLNGIGESKAKKIIEYREKNGPFKTIEDIKKVSGIGNSSFEKIKNYIKI